MSATAESVSDLMLDGSAAAGLLQEIFVPEITLAKIEGETCGHTALIGSATVWIRLGAIPRCGGSSRR